MVIKSANRAIYNNTSKNGRVFTISSIPGQRDYSYSQLPIRNDKILLISANEYPFTSEDISEMACLLIGNKSIPAARLIEANKIIKRIGEALRNPPTVEGTGL